MRDGVFFQRKTACSQRPKLMRSVCPHSNNCRIIIWWGFLFINVVLIYFLTKKLCWSENPLFWPGHISFSYDCYWFINEITWNQFAPKPSSKISSIFFLLTAVKLWRTTKKRTIWDHRPFSLSSVSYTVLFFRRVCLFVEDGNNINGHLK